ncbi:hypothetical protein JCM8097_005353 [Rhodosporidiobolus ruineniae]
MPSKAAPKKDSAEATRSYSAGEVVLAKVKGFPAWPAQVLEHDKAPVKVLKEKPKGKNINLVQFFPTGDYSWSASRDLSLLTQKEISAYLSSTNKKKGDLLEGYRIAQDPSEWNQRKADEQAEYDELVAQAAEDGDEDQLASDDGKDAKGKKRKRASEPAAKGKKTKADGKAGKKDDAPASKKAKTANSDDPGSEQVKTWRHKLQKVFLGKGAPAADEMPRCAEYFDAMESFDMKAEWLVESKLNKVLKRIAALKDGQIPDEDKYSFRDRSSALATKWAGLAGETKASPKPEGEASESAPAENGAAAEDKKDDATPAAEEKKDAESAPADEAKEGEEKKEENGEEAKADGEAMDVDAPKENGDAAAAAEEKKDDAPAAESS